MTEKYCFPQFILGPSPLSGYDQYEGIYKEYGLFRKKTGLKFACRPNHIFGFARYAFSEFP